MWGVINRNKHIEKNLYITLVIYQESSFIYNFFSCGMAGFCFFNELLWMGRMKLWWMTCFLWVVKLKRCTRKQPKIWGTFPASVWKNWGKFWNKSIKITDLRGWIVTHFFSLKSVVLMHRDNAPCCLVDFKIVWRLTTGREIILHESEKWNIAIAHVLQTHAL